MAAAVETQNAGPGPPYRRAPHLGPWGYGVGLADSSADNFLRVYISTHRLISG